MNGSGMECLLWSKEAGFWLLSNTAQSYFMFVLIVLKFLLIQCVPFRMVVHK